MFVVVLNGLGVILNDFCFGKLGLFLIEIVVSLDKGWLGFFFLVCVFFGNLERVVCCYGL